ncbi:MAG: sigma-70 family RNA polymerase sigma factor [Isosphaeraceae bacterium]
MIGDRNPQALRDLRTLFASGSLGGLTDAQLVEAFLARAGPDREDAFSALVRRHGPMVLGVCRRMLPDSADSEDAFQAVFLVLARRAESIRGLDALRPWLYGVAIRTAKEARRRSARRRAREAVAMREPQAAPAPDDDRADWLAILDEEIARLPAKYREPLQLCELEGLSRRDAADRMGLPEGTLSSRLARGRSMLRDRLIRRGVAPGVALMGPLIAGPSEAQLAGSMADSTVRLALRFVRGGTVPVAVASLAEGVLKMFAATKVTMILGGLMAMAASAALAAIIPMATPPDRDPPLQEADPEPAVMTIEKQDEEPRSDEIRGIVVNEADRPVAGAEVVIGAFQDQEVRGVTADDGSFAIPARRGGLRWVRLLARSADGASLGLFRGPDDPAWPIDSALGSS